MDKSFNDQELSDIMKEIEALEEGLDSDTEAQATEVLEELSQLHEAEAIPLRREIKAPAATHHASGQTAMSFKVKGDMQIDLQFEVGPNVVALSVTENGLSIEMDGGAKFTVPFKSAA